MCSSHEIRERTLRRRSVQLQRQPSSLAEAISRALSRVLPSLRHGISPQEGTGPGQHPRDQAGLGRLESEMDFSRGGGLYRRWEGGFEESCCLAVAKQGSLGAVRIRRGSTANKNCHGLPLRFVCPFCSLQNFTSLLTTQGVLGSSSSIKKNSRAGLAFKSMHSRPRLQYQIAVLIDRSCHGVHDVLFGHQSSRTALNVTMAFALLRLEACD